MAYLYETHLHTAEASKCATTKGKDYISAYIDKGYTGIIVTDHFYNGHCALDRSLPWKEWVNYFCSGYEKAREEGERQGLDVFFGWEETFNTGDDYLIYGLDKQWLLEHPECRRWTRKEQYHAVKKAGGCVIHAHPLRQRDYIDRIVLTPDCVDGVEAANASHEDISFDALACSYAQKTGKTIIAGTDIHNVSTVYYGEVFGIYMDKKIESITDFTKAVCTNKISGLKFDPMRFKLYGDETVSLPVEIRDENDKIINRDWKAYT